MGETCVSPMLGTPGGIRTRGLLAENQASLAARRRGRAADRLADSVSAAAGTEGACSHF
jgi:hypothetical protein